MVYQFAPVGSGQAVLYFAEKPLVLIDELLDCLLHVRLRIPALLSRKAGELGFEFGADIHFHRPKRKELTSRCQSRKCSLQMLQIMPDTSSSRAERTGLPASNLSEALEKADNISRHEIIL